MGRTSRLRESRRKLSDGASEPWKECNREMDKLCRVRAVRLLNIDPSNVSILFILRLRRTDGP